MMRSFKVDDVFSLRVEGVLVELKVLEVEGEAQDQMLRVHSDVFGLNKARQPESFWTSSFAVPFKKTDMDQVYAFESQRKEQEAREIEVSLASPSSSGRSSKSLLSNKRQQESQPDRQPAPKKTSSGARRSLLNVPPPLIRRGNKQTLADGHDDTTDSHEDIDHAVDTPSPGRQLTLEETLAAGARKESGPSMYDELVQDAEQTLMESRFERNEDSDCEFVSPIQTLEQAQQAKVSTRKMRDLQMATILTAEALKKEGSRPTNFNFHTNSIECLFVMQRKSQKKKSRRRKYLMRLLPLPQNPMFLASSVGRSAIQAGVRIS